MLQSPAFHCGQPIANTAHLGRPARPALSQTQAHLWFAYRSRIYDGKIQSLIADIPGLTHESKRNELKIALDSLTVRTQLLLKAEWEKVKREAEHGNLSEIEREDGSSEPPAVTPAGS